MAITVSAIVTAMGNFSVLYRGTKFKKFVAKSGFRSGGFCAAFEITASDNKEFYIDDDGEIQWEQSDAYIYRVPHAQMPNDRYRKQVIDNLSRLGSPYFEEFGIENKSLLVEGQLLDVTYMKKIEGQTFGEYIAQNKNNARALRTLAEKFLTMVTWLHQAQISHGDLDDNNIMVRTNGDIVLIDYDTLCFRAIEGEHTELSNGKPAFQHPSRIKQASKLTLKADYFSELIIYLSLVALSEDSSLFRYVSTGDTLLFKSADFTDLHNSDIYQELYKLSDDTKNLLKILKFYLKQKNYLDLLPFEQILAKLNSANVLSNGVPKKVQHSDFAGVYYSGDVLYIIFLVDQSSSMKENYQDGKSKSEYAASVINRSIMQLCATNMNGDKPRDSVFISIITYNTSVQEVQSGFLSDIYANPKQTYSIKQKVSDGAGGLIELNLQSPAWVEAQADGVTNMAGAFAVAKGLIKEWVNQSPFSPAPVVINISAGEIIAPQQIKVFNEFQYIEELSNRHGEYPMVFNAYLGSGESTLFPTSSNGLSQAAMFLYNISSFVPEESIQKAKRVGGDIADGAVGLIINSDAVVFINFLSFTLFVDH